MCGRLHLKKGDKQLLLDFGIEVPEFSDTRLKWWQEDRFNIAPTTLIPAIRADAEHHRTVAPMRWGLIPSWTKDLKKVGHTFNAAGETVAEKPSYRAAFKARRCVVAASGYYEWQKRDEVKYPFNIHRPNNHLLTFAGLWETWKPPEDGDPVTSCTIITINSAPGIDWLHKRMPVILDEQEFDEWLDPQNKDVESLKRFIRPYAGPLDADPLTRYVNDSRNQGPECLAPAE